MTNIFAQEFRKRAQVVTRDFRHRKLIDRALKSHETKRAESLDRYQSWGEARQAASEIKYEAINHLESYLREFIEKVEARGTKVFVAGTAQEACDFIVKVARENGVRTIIKSKTATGEEINLKDALEREAGCKLYESSLGAFIVQLRHEKPYHPEFPAMHLTRHQIGTLFEEKLGRPYTDDPPELSTIAREVMRQKYGLADMGITGANFAIAETGTICITENEGNARLGTSLPRIHLVLLGIEKILPKLEDLALFLPLLATSGAGQPLACYNTMYSGPRQPGEIDGPEQFYIVLLDNGRTELLADPEQRDSLHCIRCGACLNVCPIFKNVGGPTYGTTYSGPIGSVITPHLRGVQDWKHLSEASSMCGACTETCPVGIDLAHHLLRNRRNAIREKSAWWEKIFFRSFAGLMRHPWLYAFCLKMGALVFPLHYFIDGTSLDPLRGWTGTRDLPPLASRSFHSWWAQHARVRARTTRFHQGHKNEN